MRHGYKKRKNSAVFFLAFIVVLIISLCFFLEKQIKPIIISSAESRAQTIAAEAINRVVYQKMKEMNLTYYDLVTLEKDNNSKISAISANMSEINKVKAEFATAITEQLSKTDNAVISVSLGKLLNLPDGGPKIKLHLNMYGNVNTDISDSFSEAGINQTKHTIHLDVKSYVRILVPFYSVKAEVDSCIPIAQTIIIGDVPNTYTNIEKGENN